LAEKLGVLFNYFFISLYLLIYLKFGVKAPFHVIIDLLIGRGKCYSSKGFVIGLSAILGTQCNNYEEQ